MPLVRISALASFTDDELTEICDGVFEAVVDVLDKPGDMRFVSIDTFDPDRLRFHRSYMGLPDVDHGVFVHVTLSHGRTASQKRRLYEVIGENVRRAVKIKPRELQILIAEAAALSWSFGDGTVRYVSARSTI